MHQLYVVLTCVAMRVVFFSLIVVVVVLTSKAVMHKGAENIDFGSEYANGEKILGKMQKLSHMIQNCYTISSQEMVWE